MGIGTAPTGGTAVGIPPRDRGIAMPGGGTGGAARAMGVANPVIQTTYSTVIL